MLIIEEKVVIVQNEFQSFDYEFLRKSRINETCVFLHPVRNCLNAERVWDIRVSTCNVKTDQKRILRNCFRNKTQEVEMWSILT